MSAMYRALVWDGRVSLNVLDTTALVNETLLRHALSAGAAEALGQLLTGTAYLCGWLKGGGLSVSVSGGGSGGRLLAGGDHTLRLCGYVQDPQAEGTGAEVVGENGYLTVSRDEGRGIPFTGMCRLERGLAASFAAYFEESEQCPTAVALGVRIKDGVCTGAGGIFLQPLPGADEALRTRAFGTAASFENVGLLIAKKGALGVLRSVENVPYVRRRILFGCHCSRARAEAAVLTLGRAGAEAILEERKEIRVHCEYCNTDYLFGPSDIRRLFTERT